MKDLIEHLFSKSAELNNPIANAMRGELSVNYPEMIECQIVLKNGYSAAGVLSRFDDQMLRMTSIAKTPDGKVMMADQFFQGADIMTLVIGREPPKSMIQQPGHNGSSIILGH